MLEVSRMAESVALPPLEEAPAVAAPALPTRDELRDILGIALQGGQLLLENGAETWRVEETLQHLGVGLGAEWMDIYPTPTGIIISTVAANEHRTRIRRVTNLGVDLSRVGAVLDLSRRAYAGELSRDTARVEMEQVAHMPRAYPQWLTLAVLAVGCAAFGGLAGGGWPAIALGLFAAAMTVLTRHGLNRFFGRPVLLSVAISAFVGTSAAILGLRLFPSPLPETVVVAAIISLIPGVPMILSIADLINANYVSGLARGAQAALYLSAIAVGTAVSLALLGGPAFA
jgi:uncharacterized membrane protein YjjP (DUF1212 family)